MTRRGLSILALVAALCTPALAQVTRPGGGVVPPTKLGGAGSGGGGGGGGTVTSIIAGAGLSGGTITTTGTIAVNLTTTTCSAGQAVTAISALGVGTCSTFFNAAGAGLSATGSSVAVNLTTTSCSAGSAETATAANGTSTCGAVLVSGVATANGGLVASTSSGAFTVGLITSCGSNQVLAFVGSIWTCTTPNVGTVTSIIAGAGLSGGTITSSGTIAVNLTTTTCSAGQAETATAANGTSTCSAVVTSVSSGAGGINGLTCSTTAGATTCWAGSATGCSAGQVMEDVAGGSGGWNCITPSVGTVTSVGTSAPISGGTITGTGTIGLTACAANQIYEFTGGVWTCVAMPSSTGTVTSITCSTGLSCTAANPIVASGTIALNITTTTCTAGQAVTAISAAGVGTCTTLISGTLNTVPVFATANTIGNSSITDDLTTLKVNTTAMVLTESTGAVTFGSTITATGRIFSGGSATYLQGGGGIGGLDFLTNTNAVATGHINDVGFSLSTTQFRNLEIDDGKGAAIVTVTGSTKDVTLAATETVTGLATLTGGFSAGANSTTNGNALTVGILLVGGHISFDTGAAPTVSSCGASPSIATGSTDVSGIITLGAATTTLCTYTFATTWSTRAPFCTCSNAGSTSTEALVSCTASTTVLTINATSASSAGVFSYYCRGST